MNFNIHNLFKRNIDPHNIKPICIQRPPTWAEHWPLGQNENCKEALQLWRQTVRPLILQVVLSTITKCYKKSLLSGPHILFLFFLFFYFFSFWRVVETTAIHQIHYDNSPSLLFSVRHLSSNSSFFYDSKEEKAAEIFKLLKAKNFGILLDDMWERLNLFEVGIPNLNDQTKSKVVLTTRSEQVCNEMEAHKRMKHFLCSVTRLVRMSWIHI